MNRLNKMREELESMAEQRLPRREAGGGSRLIALLLGAGAGALGTYLLDPDRGRSRRARLGDQAAALLRRGGRQLDRTGRLVTATVEGKAQALRHTGPGEAPPNDAALVEKVESELYRDATVPKGTININAENGVIVIRGELPDIETRERIDATIRRIPGVWDVSDLTHLVGEAAPTGS